MLLLVGNLAFKNYWLAISENYASMATAHLVSDFIHIHSRPPNGWEELESSSVQALGQYGFSATFELERLLEVDFDLMKQRSKSLESSFLKTRRRSIFFQTRLTDANEWILREL